MEPNRPSTAGAGLTRRIHTGEVELQVLDRGQGPPLVLLHGFPLDHSMWDNQIEPLAQHHRVIAPDLRGFGGSQVVAGTATMEQMADDVAAVLQALDISEPAVIGGLSMGGYVAFAFWACHPNRVRALVLCDTRAIADTAEAAQGRHDLAAKILAEGTTPLADGMLPKLFAPHTLREHASMTALQRDVILRTAPEGAAAALRGMAVRTDRRPELPTIGVPTAVIVGEHDAISTVAEMRTLAEMLPQAEFTVIPDAGHMTPLENADAFLKALETFLERLPGDA